MSLLARLASLRSSGERGVLFTVVEGDRAGAKVLVVEGAETIGDGVPDAAIAEFDDVVRKGRNRLLDLGDGVRVFAEWYGPPPRLFVYGAVDTAESLCRGAKLLRLVGDRRRRPPGASTREFPSADQLIAKWPKEAIAELAPDHQTAIVVLARDDKFDEPALIAALDSEAFYVGALGSRRTTERRRQRLVEAGVPPRRRPDHGPMQGLDMGADTQEETALSILAEILAVRAGRGSRSARRSSASHVEQD